MIFAAFRPALHTVAFAAGFASVVSFIWLCWSVGGYNTQLARVLTADLIALACLVIGAAAAVWMRLRG